MNSIIDTSTSASVDDTYPRLRVTRTGATLLVLGAASMISPWQAYAWYTSSEPRFNFWLSAPAKLAAAAGGAAIAATGWALTHRPDLIQRLRTVVFLAGVVAVAIWWRAGSVVGTAYDRQEGDYVGDGVSYAPWMFIGFVASAAAVIAGLFLMWATNIPELAGGEEPPRQAAPRVWSPPPSPLLSADLTPPPSPPGTDVAAQLERLALLHQSADLSMRSSQPRNDPCLAERRERPLRCT